MKKRNIYIESKSRASALDRQPGNLNPHRQQKRHMSWSSDQKTGDQYKYKMSSVARKWFRTVRLTLTQVNRIEASMLADAYIIL